MTSSHVRKHIAVKLHPFRCQPIQMGRAYLGASKRSDIAVAHVIDEDQDHIGRRHCIGIKRHGPDQTQYAQQ